MSAPFDPAAWFARFVAAGGSYALASDGKLWLGNIEAVPTIETHTAQLARRPDRMQAVKALVREQCLIS